tara:strand:- start:318 stop:491 length:174 start_codon:yes stop_codon:yes gene_type:complete
VIEPVDDDSLAPGKDTSVMVFFVMELREHVPRFAHAGLLFGNASQSELNTPGQALHQ